MEEIRELHAPAGDYWLKCEGCDAEGYEWEYPEWSCRTAKLVYTESEINIIETHASLHRQEIDTKRREEQEKNPRPCCNRFMSR